MGFFEDTFTDTDGILLQNHTPDVGDSWTRLWQSVAGLDAEINTNRCRGKDDVNDGMIYVADATYPSADYDIACTMVSLQNNNDRPLYLLVRVQDVENMYAVRLEITASESSLYKKVSGTWTALGSLFTRPANGSVIKLEIIGDELKFYDDGVELASATDSDISAAGKAGLAWGGGSELVVGGDDASVGNVVDTLSVNDLGVGDLTIELDTLTLVSSVQDFSTIPGAVSITMDTLNLAGAIQALTLTTLTSILLDTLTLSGAIQSLTVLPGAVILTLDTLNLVGNVESLTIVTVTSISLDTLILAGDVQNLTLVTGVVSIILDTLTLASNVEDLTIALGALSILLDTLNLSASVQGLTIVPGSVAINLDTLSLASDVQPLSLLSSASILLDTLNLTMDAENLTLLPGGVTINLDTLNLAATVQDLNVFLAGAILQALFKGMYKGMYKRMR